MQISETLAHELYAMLQDYRIGEYAKLNEAKREHMPQIVGFYEQRIAKADAAIDTIGNELFLLSQ